MATGILLSSTLTRHLLQGSPLGHRSFLSSVVNNDHIRHTRILSSWKKKKKNKRVDNWALEAKRKIISELDNSSKLIEGENNHMPSRLTKRMLQKQSERSTYLAAAILSSVGITSMAIVAVFYRYSWQYQGEEIPAVEMFGTFALAVGSCVGMEFWARWAHRALWHASLWNMHESHHRPRDGPFELNDVFAIINAVPAISLLSYGFFNKGFIPGLCFDSGLGITMFGMAYMFVHDGLVHSRFPVGPIANVPYLQKVAAAHQIHHSNKFNGVPYGLFLGDKELEEIGGMEELNIQIKRRTKFLKNGRSILDNK